jgi:hypothetical protein
LKVSKELVQIHPLYNSIVDVTISMADMSVCKKSTSGSSENLESLPQEDISIKVMSCDICGKSDFGQKNPQSGLTRHIKSMHPETVVKSEIPCPHCEKMCGNASGLSRHIKIKHPV